MLTSQLAVDQDWLYKNSRRAYPLVDWATYVDDEGRELPMSAILDMSLTLSSTTVFPSTAVAPCNLYVSKLSIEMQKVEIEISEDITNSVVASGACVPSTNNSVNLLAATLMPVYDPGDKFVGHVYISVVDLGLTDFGTYTFSSPAQTGVLHSVVSVVPSSILSGMTFETDDGNIIGPLTGTVTIRAGGNTRFVIDEDGTIVISAIDDVYIRGGSADNVSPIKCINGVGPDANGNITLSPGTAGVSIAVKTAGLELRTDQAKPCGSYGENQTLKSALSDVTELAQNLLSMGNRLELTHDQIYGLVSAMSALNLKTPTS